MKRTGGEKTDELLGQNGSGPEGLPHSIIVTPEGVEGEVPAPVAEVAATPGPPNGAAKTNGGPPPSGAGAGAKGARRSGRKRTTKARAKARPTARKRR